MSGDTQAPGEKLWGVREASGYGLDYRVHGPERYIYAKSRKDAKNQFIKAGYKQFKSSRLTAVRGGDA